MRAKSILLAGAFIGLVSSAVAQQPITLPPGLPPLPSAGAQTAPALPPTAQPITIRPFNTEPPMPAGTPATPPAQPAGGFGATPPAPGSNDPAQRMNLDNSAAYSTKLQEEGRSRLGQMTGNAATPTPSGGALSPAPIASQSDLEALTKIQRNISILDAQVKEAELAVKLWHTLYNNADAKEWREEEKKAKAEATKAAEASPPPALLGAAGAQASAPITVDPVVVEVMGSRARLLMPGSGEIVVRTGQVLPEGRIVSVGLGGVVLDKGGRRVTLGFGTSIPGMMGTASGPAPNAFARPMAR